MSEALQVAGAIAAAAAASAALLAPRRRLRAAAMLAAVLLATALVAGEAWNDQLADLRDRPAELAAMLAAALVAVGLVAFLCSRQPLLLPLLLLAALPFRIPIDAGGETSNLLVPLYLVIAAGIVLEAVNAWRSPEDPATSSARRARAVQILAYLLSASLVLYALQTVYSSEVSRAVQNLAFFLVPFAVMFALLREADWTPRLLRAALVLVLAEGVVFGLVGIVQHQAGHIFWNDKVMESNEFDLYFRVNSLFWDPNIYGRYLAMTAVVGVAALLWVDDGRRFAAGVVAITIVFAGLAFSFSQTSFLALVIGLVVLCALRWSLRWTAAAAAAAVVLAVCVFAFTDALTVDSQSGGELAQTTSGRSRLASGGIDLAEERPVAGFGSGSFAVEFEERNPVPSDEAVVSHTEPITVAAEQGALGIAVYVALLLGAALVVFGGMRALAPGLGGRVPAARGPGSRRRAVTVGRIAVAAAFAGLVIHTMGYAGFLVDPLAWALLAVASALAAETPAADAGR